MSEGARGGAGETFQEGVEGFAGSISEQVGEGTSLAQLDTARLRSDTGKSAAAGLALGTAPGAVTGVVGRAQRQSREQEVRKANEQANEQAGGDQVKETHG